MFKGSMGPLFLFWTPRTETIVLSLYVHKFKLLCLTTNVPGWQLAPKSVKNVIWTLNASLHLAHVGLVVSILPIFNLLVGAK